MTSALGSTWSTVSYRIEPAHEHVLNFPAHLVQHPGVRINHALFLGSKVQGIGKDSIAQPVVVILGHHNCAITQLDLENDFNDWILERSLVQAQELKAFESKRLANQLKPYLTSPPNYLRLNRKNVAQFDVPNICNWLLTTNSESPSPSKKVIAASFPFLALRGHADSGVLA